jgi:tetratricopeptide (TPR) repeat protein
MAGLAACKEMNGVMANQQGKHNEALELFKQAHALYQQVNAPDNEIGLILNHIGNCYNYLLQTEEAEKYYRQAIETLQKTDRKQTINIIKSNLGLLMYHRERYTEAIAMFEEGLAGYIEYNNMHAQIQAHSHIGHSYLCLKEHAKALLYFQKGLKLIRNSKIDNELSSIYQGLGKLYTEMGGHKEALKYLSRALEIRLKKSFWALCCETYESIYKLHTLTGDSVNANQALAEGRKLSIESGLEDWQVKFNSISTSISSFSYTKARY